jgi:hypothetical protein
VNALDDRRLASLIDKRLIGMLGLRPPNSSGWGMLRAVKSGTFTSKSGERTTITAGTTRVSSDYWLARERPELFMPIDKRDTRTIAAHSRNLEHARQTLERGRTTRPATTRTGGVLPPRAGGSTLRLPGGPSGARPLKLPR